MRDEARATLKIGDIEITPLLDGPLPATLGKIPDPRHRAEAEKLLESAPADALTMPVFGYLLKLGARHALVDAGAGALMSKELGQLADALAASGVSPAQIATIYMTHMHKDHFGGLVDAAGAAVFPNAELVLHETEAAFWMDRAFEDMPERAWRFFDVTRTTLAAYGDRVRRAREGEDIQGVSAHLAPGHTPGHACWLAQSGGKSVLAWGDLIHIAYLHLPAPHVVMEYDLDPALALQSRRRVLDWVTKDAIPVAGAHLPAPGIHSIARRGEAFGLATG